MKRSTESVEAGSMRPVLGTGLALVLLAAATLAEAGKVTPPPLPPGSALVKVEPGMDKREQDREDRAHHHKGHVKKDINKDDSESGNNGNGNGNGNGKGNNK
jgi:hypothetical protein